MKQTCILILGMHRSGTSALTGVLGFLEVYLGSELMEANFANEKGYFENNILYKINEELLSHINSSWDDLFYNEVKLETIKEITKLKGSIKSEFEYADTFAIKDPRLVFLFPVYEKVLNELNIDAKIIIPFRNPVEVASSLHKRDGMSMEKGMLLWAYHFLLAEKFSRGYERVFVEFDDLISDTQKVINNISMKLSLDLNEKYTQNKKKIEGFLEPGLKHHNISIDNLSGNTPKIVKDILVLKEKLNDIELSKEFDDLRDEVFSYQKLFYNIDVVNSLNEAVAAKQVLQEKDSMLVRTKGLLQERESELTKAKQILQEKGISLAQAKQAAHKNERELSQVQQTLQVKVGELRQAQQTMQKYENEISQAKQWLNQNKFALQEKENEILIMKKELTNIYMSKSWKLTRVMRKFMRIVQK